MASSLVSFLATGNYISSSCRVISSHDIDRCTFGQASFPNKSKSRELSVVSVATDFPLVVQQQPWKEVEKEKKLVAWTSIQQDRWDGELIVEGKIPQWLVCVCVTRCTC